MVCEYQECMACKCVGGDGSGYAGMQGYRFVLALQCLGVQMCVPYAYVHYAM